MNPMAEVGDRIRRAMPDGMSQRQLAEQAGMTPDALSRALNGLRGLSLPEVAEIAKTLAVDTHWLITGAPDPLAVTIAARHAWDAARRERHNPGQQGDQPMLDRVAGVYRAAFPQGANPSADLPSTATQMRKLLGDGFVRDFAELVEQQLGVDVIRIPGLATDYSLRIGNRGVIVLTTQPSWFRSNWSLAHELGHLALKHHAANASAQRIDRDEQTADAFAAALLVPRDELKRVAAASSESALAREVWRLGVSTEALRNRLAAARLQVLHPLADALQSTTPRLLRAHLDALTPAEGAIDVVTAREQAASARRFPLGLLSALQAQTERGAASPTHLAWALDVPVDEIEFPETDENDNNYEQMLSERPSPTQWRSIIEAATPIQ